MTKLAASLFIAVILQISIFGSFRFPNRSTPATCSTAGKGLAYFDTDDNAPLFCNGTDWTSFGVTLAGANTWTGFNIFNRTATGEDACFGGDGTPPSVCIDGTNERLSFFGVFENVILGANASGNLDIHTTRLTLEIADGDVQQTLAPLVAGTTSAGDQRSISMVAADGDDTFTLFSINNFTDRNHTGTGNFIRALFIGTIFSPDSDARHTALEVADGWEVGYRQKTGITFATLPTTPGTGFMEITFCNDCQGTGGVSGTACATGGSGALAFSVRDAWICIH